MACVPFSCAGRKSVRRSSGHIALWRGRISLLLFCLESGGPHTAGQNSGTLSGRASRIRWTGRFVRASRGTKWEQFKAQCARRWRCFIEAQNSPTDFCASMAVGADRRFARTACIRRGVCDRWTKARPAGCQRTERALPRCWLIRADSVRNFNSCFWPLRSSPLTARSRMAVNRASTSQSTVSGTVFLLFYDRNGL
jgi:hypothetical protein